MHSSQAALKNIFLLILLDTWKICSVLFKIMIPMMTLVKILQELGFVEVLGRILAPLMQLLSLPGEAGLILASAMLTNLYGAMTVFATLNAQNFLTVAQTSVLCSMMLVAHNLLVELRIAQASGVSILLMGFWRVMMAFLYGFLLMKIFSVLNVFSEPTHLQWVSEIHDTTLVAWIGEQCLRLLLISAVIFLLLFLMQILKALDLIYYLEKILHLPLRYLGMSSSAVSTCVIGFTLGLAYGGAFIIRDAKAGVLQYKDILCVHLFLGITHSFFEDTFLMLLLGARFEAVFLGKLFFTYIMVYFAMKLYSRKISAEVF